MEEYVLYTILVGYCGFILPVTEEKRVCGTTAAAITSRVFEEDTLVFAVAITSTVFEEDTLVVFAVAITSRVFEENTLAVFA